VQQDRNRRERGGIKNPIAYSGGEGGQGGERGSDIRNRDIPGKFKDEIYGQGEKLKINNSITPKLNRVVLESSR